MHIVTLQKSNINSIADFKGKRIGLPAVGTTGYFQAEAILKSYGLTLKDITGTPMTQGEQGDALKDGTIDVAIVTGGVPIACVMDLSTTNDVKLITIDPDKARIITEEYPYWWVDKLPAGKYRGQEEDVNVLMAKVLLMANNNLDEDIVYRIAKVLNESKEDLKRIHEEGQNWSIESTKQLYNKGLVPFHKGAQKYYNEVFSGK